MSTCPTHSAHLEVAYVQAADYLQDEALTKATTEALSQAFLPASYHARPNRVGYLLIADIIPTQLDRSRAMKVLTPRPPQLWPSTSTRPCLPCFLKTPTPSPARDCAVIFGTHSIRLPLIQPRTITLLCFRKSEFLALFYGDSSHNTCQGVHPCLACDLQHSCQSCVHFPHQ